MWDVDVVRSWYNVWNDGEFIEDASIEVFNWLKNSFRDFWVLKKIEVVQLVNDSKFSSLENDCVEINQLNELLLAVNTGFNAFCHNPFCECAAASIFFVKSKETFAKFK